jgi:hypothetical protein
MGSPAVVVEVLLASGRIDPGRLKMAPRVQADPDLTPGRWDRELADPFEHLRVIDGGAVGIDVLEASTSPAAADAR